MRSADGQGDDKDLAATDFEARHAHGRWSSIFELEADPALSMRPNTNKIRIGRLQK
jgi:hypothetical protein